MPPSAAWSETQLFCGLIEGQSGVMRTPGPGEGQVVLAGAISATVGDVAGAISPTVGDEAGVDAVALICRRLHRHC